MIAVAHAGLGEQVAGPRRVVFELAAQVGHMEPQVVRVLLEAGPHTLVRSCAEPTSWPGHCNSSSRIAHSVGVRRSVLTEPDDSTAPSARVTWCELRSTLQ